MFDVRRTPEFAAWLGGLRDRSAAARIARRLDRLAEGHFGDAKSVGGGVSELRFAFGAGYRVYYTRRGNLVVLLLCGGDKDTQSRDIECAQAMAKEV